MNVLSVLPVLYLNIVKTEKTLQFWGKSVDVQRNRLRKHRECLIEKTHSLSLSATDVKNLSQFKNVLCEWTNFEEKEREDPIIVLTS